MYHTLCYPRLVDATLPGAKLLFHSNLLYPTLPLLHCNVLYRILLDSTLLYFRLLYSTLLYSILPSSTLLY